MTRIQYSIFNIFTDILHQYQYLWYFSTKWFEGTQSCASKPSRNKPAANMMAFTVGTSN